SLPKTVNWSNIAPGSWASAWRMPEPDLPASSSWLLAASDPPHRTSLLEASSQKRFFIHETSRRGADRERWPHPRLPEDAAPAHAAQMGISRRQNRRRRTASRCHAPGTGGRTGNRGGGGRGGCPHRP